MNCEVSVRDLLGHLNEIEEKYAPETVFIAGDPTLIQAHARVAIIGSRDASQLALQRASRLAKVLVGEHVVVVSGLARGIDAAAHRAAIKHGGHTVAVLGTPLDQCSPRGHRDLQDRIMRKHLAVSQFPPGSSVYRSNFVRRNRLMALLSNASVIVEAGETSGTLHQGWEALRLGRPLFIMKSVVERPDLSWPAEMIEYGAETLSEPEELLAVVPHGSPSSPTEVAL